MDLRDKRHSRARRNQPDTLAVRENVAPRYLHTFVQSGKSERDFLPFPRSARTTRLLPRHARWAAHASRSLQSLVVNREYIYASRAAGKVLFMGAGPPFTPMSTTRYVRPRYFLASR